MVINVETSGFDKKIDSIIQISAYKINWDNKSIEKVFNSFVNSEIDREIMRERLKLSRKDKFPELNEKQIQNLVDNKLKHIDAAKSLEEYRDTLTQLFQYYEVTGYNLKFDLDF